MLQTISRFVPGVVLRGFKRLTQPAMRRLYKFALKRLIGRYLLEEITSEQLDVSLTNGRVHLDDVHLDCDELNALLGENAAVHIVRGYIGSVELNLSYTTENPRCSIELHNIEVFVAPGPPPRARTRSGGNASARAAGAAGGGKAGEGEGEGEGGWGDDDEYAGAGGDYGDYGAQDDTEQDPEYDDGGSDAGLHVLSGLIERISRNTKVSIHNVDVVFQPQRDESAPHALLCRFPRIEVKDETPSQYRDASDEGGAEGGRRGGDVGGDGGGDGSMHLKQPRSSPYEHKGFRLFGFSVHVLDRAAWEAPLEQSMAASGGAGDLSGSMTASMMSGSVMGGTVPVDGEAASGIRCSTELIWIDPKVRGEGVVCCVLCDCEFVARALVYVSACFVLFVALSLWFSLLWLSLCGSLFVLSLCGSLCDSGSSCVGPSFGRRWALLCCACLTLVPSPHAPPH